MGIGSLILISTAVLFMFFVVLSGVKNHTPLNKVWFLQADTSHIAGARPISQWTYFYVCGNHNQNCGSPVPALPLGYAWNAGNSGAPPQLVGYVSSHLIARRCGKLTKSIALMATAQLANTSTTCGASAGSSTSCRLSSPYSVS